MKERFNNAYKVFCEAKKVPFKMLGGKDRFVHEVKETHVGKKFNWFFTWRTGQDHLAVNYAENINKEL